MDAFDSFDGAVFIAKSYRQTSHEVIDATLRDKSLRYPRCSLIFNWHEN